jgi:hypothetical protein
MNLAKESINKEFLSFRRFQVDVKESNVLFDSEKNMNLCFIQLDYLLVRF